jgi:hypothetical protein
MMLGTVCVAILAVAAAFHFYWGVGGALGRSVSLPQTEDERPVISMRPYGTHAVGVALVVSITLILAFEKQISLPLPPTLVRISMVVLSVCFALRALSWHTYVGMFKKVRGTRFAKYDTWIYSPLCLIVSLCIFLLLENET